MSVQAFSRPAPRAMLRSGHEVSRVTSRKKSWHDAGVHNPAFDSRCQTAYALTDAGIELSYSTHSYA
jgi:hypothetical protein